MNRALQESRWEHFPHAADVGVRGFGPTLAAAFEGAALGLTAATADPERVAPRIPVKIACAAPDRELLLVEWLNAIVFEMATRRMLFSRYQVRVREGDAPEGGLALEGAAWGEPVDALAGEIGVEVKGATYTALRVAEGADGWVAQCVVDV